MRLLRQNTATTVTVGPVTGTDGLTPQNSVTFPSRATTNTATTGYLFLQNGTSVVLSSTAITSWTALGVGSYSLGLLASDINFTGILRLIGFNGSTNFFDEVFEVISQVAYDSLFAGGSPGLPVNVVLVDGAAATESAGPIDANLLSVNGTTFSGPSVPTNVVKWLGVDPNALIGGRVDASAGSVLDKSGYVLNSPPPSSSVIASAVWDLATTGHTTGGSFGSSMNAAGSSGDPWATEIPGSYGTGTAGKILGTSGGFTDQNLASIVTAVSQSISPKVSSGGTGDQGSQGQNNTMYILSGDSVHSSARS